MTTTMQQLQESPQPKRAQGSPDCGDRHRDQRTEQPNVGNHRGPRWHGLRGRIQRHRSRRQWPGSRVISAQKANTANSFSLDSTSNSGGSGQPNGLALSTANLYSAVQPGGSLFGLQESNPVDTDVAYKGPSSRFGTSQDPMEGNKIGGVNVFGGGLALYAAGKKIVGGVGVSGDTSCADHNIAWRVRNNLGLDHLPESAESPATAASRQHHLRHQGQPEWRHWHQRRRVWPPDVPQYIWFQHTACSGAVACDVQTTTLLKGQWSSSSTWILGRIIDGATRRGW